ncbi:MAG: diaminopimelate decarboxylase [Bacilli bacterium]|nr:diaminopimelate decarboxylase [Bacilli bacterium]
MIKKLLNKYGSPLYVYDKSILIKRCNEMIEFKNRLENNLNVDISMHYSIKANENLSLLKIIKDCGLKVDSMSELELYLSRLVGFNKDEILYVCNNITEKEMKNVHDNNILICLDSISQVETWGKNFPNTNIMVRINTGILGVGHSDKVITSGKVTKFGIAISEINELFNIIKKYNLNIIGVHEHLGSLFLNDKMDNYLEGIESFLKVVVSYFPNVEIIDLGGGFGVPYKDEDRLDLNLLCKKLTDLLKKYIKQLHLKEIKFEPGRYIVCECGKIYGIVTSIKKLNNYYIGTDIGMNDLIRPSMYDAYHKIELSPKRDTEKIIANFCGTICESSDILGKDRIVNMPKVNDNVVIYNTGAYGYSMSSNYTGRLRGAEVLLDGDKDILIRKRETIEDIINLQK